MCELTETPLCLGSSTSARRRPLAEANPRLDIPSSNSLPNVLRMSRRHDRVPNEPWVTGAVVRLNDRHGRKKCRQSLGQGTRLESGLRSVEQYVDVARKGRETLVVPVR